MERKRFERLVDRIFAELPGEVLSYVDNAVFVVEDWPDPETLASQGPRHRTDLLGLYQGLPLDELHEGLRCISAALGTVPGPA